MTKELIENIRAIIVPYMAYDLRRINYENMGEIDAEQFKEDMNEIFKELGKINSTYGTYYIFGNHDTQPDSIDYENGNRTFSDRELNKSIIKSLPSSLQNSE